MITFRQEGNFSKLDNFLEKLKGIVNLSTLDTYGRRGVEALSSATPTKTGETANSWYYTIERSDNTISLIFHNSNITEEGTPIAILLQYGHATGNGGYVEGVDYINPAIVPIFEEIASDAWKEVEKL